MEKKDYENKVRYMQKEFDEKNDYIIGLFLLQDVESAKEEGRRSIVEYILKEYPDFYAELFTEIFIRPYGGLIYFTELLPHLDIKYILDYLKSKISEVTDIEKEKYLEFFRIIYNYLIQIATLILLKRIGDNTNFNKLYTLMQNQMAPHSHLDEHIEFFEKNLDKGFIVEAARYLYSEGIDTVYAFENIIFRFPLEINGILEDNYETLAKSAQEDEFEAYIIINFYFVLIDYYVLKVRDIDRAERWVDFLIKDFYDYVGVEDKFLRVKVANRKLEEVKHYIENRYRKEDIEQNPRFLMYLSEYHQLYGEIPEAIDKSKKAFEVSGKSSEYLAEYCKVLILKDPDEAKNALRNYLKDKDNILRPDHLMFLTSVFF